MKPVKYTSILVTILISYVILLLLAIGLMILKDKADILPERMLVPVYTYNRRITEDSLAAFDRFAAHTIQYTSGRVSDSTYHENMEKQIKDPSETVNILKEVEIWREISNTTTIRDKLNALREFLSSVMNKGIVKLEERPGIQTRRIQVWYPVIDEGYRKEQYSNDRIYTTDNIRREVLRTVDGSTQQKNIYASIIESFLQPNTFLNEDITGELMKTFNNGSRQNKGPPGIFGHFATIAGTALFLLLLYASGVILINITGEYKKHRREMAYLYIFFGIAYAILAVITNFFTAGFSDFLPVLVVPTALFTMLLAILLSETLASIFSLQVFLFVLLISGFDLGPSVFVLFSGFAGTVAVRGAKRRIDLVRASLFLAIAGGLVVLILQLVLNGNMSLYITDVIWAMVNGFFCGILNLGLLPIFEHILNLPTRFRLMELSDLNLPVFKKMLTLAPGTYGHSVSVANMAESACEEIGADPLLARVGSYFHDIGKIDQAEYFIENQKAENKHDELKPSLSAAIIKSHVKIGVEKAKEQGLPLEVIQIIAQHHGRSIIAYFYDQAKKDKSNSKISPEDFSYAGPPPMSREAAVVMLADIVDAFSRTLKKPTVSKIEKHIWKLMLDKFNQGQLNDSHLTFRDLETVKKTFVHILAGNFHSRIEYPETGEES